MTTLAKQPAAFEKVAELITLPFAAVGSFFSGITLANSRIAEFEALNALSDKELAARGLAREDLAREIFKDCLGV